MPKWVGLKDSDFDPKRYDNAYGRNKNETVLTTDSLVAAATAVHESVGPRLAEAAMKSPLFIREKGGHG